MVVQCTQPTHTYSSNCSFGHSIMFSVLLRVDLFILNSKMFLLTIIKYNSKIFFYLQVFVYDYLQILLLEDAKICPCLPLFNVIFYNIALVKLSTFHKKASITIMSLFEISSYPLHSSRQPNTHNDALAISNLFYIAFLLCSANDLPPFKADTRVICWACFACVFCDHIK